MNKVAIVAVNYNGKKDTFELLESLKILNTPDVLSKVIFVDNGSTDGSVSGIKAQYPEVDILQNGENKGFAGGYNRGIDYALIWGADYILIINNDCLIKDTNLLEGLIKTFKTNDKIGLISPKIYFAPGFEFHKNRYQDTERGKVIWYAGGYFDWDNIHAVHRGLDEADHGQYDKIEEVDFISGACMLIKREVIEKVGLFDEKYFLYFEDCDFQKRVSDAGFKRYYNGRVAIYHKVSRSTGIGSILTDYFHARNRLIFGMKYGGIRTKIALWREAIKLLFFGRLAQRKGVWDFFMGETLGVYLTHIQGVQGEGVLRAAEYPLKLTIGIVSFNTADLTKKLLKSIFKKQQQPGMSPQPMPGMGMEVLVLDNGSEDNCRDVIKEFLPKVKYLQNKENKGFAKGYNKLIRYSRGQYFLMLNSDIEVPGDGISEIIKWADHFKGEAVLGGKLHFPDRSNQDSVFHLPTIWGAFKEYFLGKKGSYFMYLPKSDQPFRVDGMVMACYLIPWNIINKVGVLDEGTFIFFEDIEYARRLKQANILLYFIPSAKFIHHHGGATKRIGETKAYKLLKQGAIHYHGAVYYHLLSFILWLGQKLGRVKTPVSRWISS